MPRPSEYYPYAARQEERTPLLLTDSTLFYRAVQTTPDLYAEHTAFNLPYVSVKRRGLNYRDESASVGVVRLSSRYFGAMRLLGADEVRYGGLAAADGVTGVYSSMWSVRYLSRKLNEEMSLPQASWTVT